MAGYSSRQFTVQRADTLKAGDMIVDDKVGLARVEVVEALGDRIYLDIRAWRLTTRRLLPHQTVRVATRLT